MFLLYFFFFFSSNDIVLINQVQNIGKINEGQIKEVVFKVKNTSSKPVKIFSATSTCGCTSFSYPTYLNPNCRLPLSSAS